MDYIGDLAHFEAEFARHAAIARTLGPYKLGLHSGSDKFGIYPIVARHTRGLAHVKTAGTSYLEALRTIAFTEPALLRLVWQLARERYEVDRATYHVSADLSSVPNADGLPEQTLVALLDQPNARQVLHVTFGSVLACFGARLRSVIQQHEEEYYAAIESHFVRHLDGLSQCD